MMMSQRRLDLLADPVAEELLKSTALARLAYTWPDGTPRVVPIWFHWTGQALVMASPETAPKIRALHQSPRVAITIDATPFPYRVLLLRGDATLDWVDGVPDEYAAAAMRYFGPEHGTAWVAQLKRPGRRMARIAVRPDWARVLDFTTRFPSALVSHLGSASEEEVDR
jgi:Pyridoxamine 5'-phosphate oxidase